MKYFISTLFIISLFAQTTNAQSFTPTYSNNSNFLDTTLKTVTAASATCLTRKTLSDLASNKIVTDKVKSAVSSAIKWMGGGELGKKIFEKIASGGAEPVTDEKVQKLLNRLIQKEDCWDGIASSFGNIALEKITRETIAWVNTGLDGNPTYVRNIDTLLKSIRNQQLELMLPQLQQNDPIFGNTLRGVLTKQISGRKVVIPLNIKNSPESEKYMSFMTNFNDGGWNALLNTRNNPLSSFFSAVNTVSGNLKNQEQNTRDEINRNNGFLDIKECVEWENEGRVVGGGMSGESKCLRYATTHPGTLIVRQLERIYNTPIYKIEQVDEINEVLHGFFYNLLNKTFAKTGKDKSGIFHIGNELENIPFGGTTMGVNLAFDANGKAVLSNNSIGAGLSKGADSVDISRPQELREIIETQYEFIATTRDALIVAADIIPELGQLDYCLPGPNPAWVDTDTEGSLADNFNKMLEDGFGPNWKMTDRRLISADRETTTYDSWREIGVDRTIALLSDFSITDKITGKVFRTNLANLADNVILRRIIPIYFPMDKSVGGTRSKRVDWPVLIRPNSPIFFADYITLDINYIMGANIKDLLLYQIPFYFSTAFMDEKMFTAWSAETMSKLVDELIVKYNRDTIIEAFGSAVSNPLDQTLNRGTASSAYREASSLVSYVQSYDEIIPEYDMAVADTEALIGELLVIHQEAQEIVKIAKERYIRQRAEIGDPVNMACIDGAYVINENIIQPKNRRERIDINANPKIQKVQESRKYFEEIALINNKETRGVSGNQ